MRRSFKTKTFRRWMRKTLLTDKALHQAIEEMECGLIDADLGGNTLEEKLYKKRVPLPSRGKRGSTRTIVTTSKAGRWFFLYGFEKNEKDNISDHDLAQLRSIAEGWLAAADELLTQAVIAGEIEEICHDQE